MNCAWNSHASKEIFSEHQLGEHFCHFKKVFRKFKSQILIGCIGAGNQADSCEIPYRADEKYWVLA